MDLSINNVITDYKHLISTTNEKKGGLASLPSEGCVGLERGSFGQSALFGYFLGKQKVTKRSREVKI
jgi:hypothetical protein